MSKPLVRGRGTKRSSDIGEFGAKRGGGAGKGDLIGSSFGDGWLQNIEERLAKRTNICGNPKCNIERPAGKCATCGWEPREGKDW